MLLGFNTNGLQNHRLDDALHLLAESGYRAVALTLDVQHLDPFRSTRAEVDHAARLLARLDLTPVIETGARYLLDPRAKHEPTLMTRSPGGRERRLEFYRHAADLGGALGARVLSFWSGVDRTPAPDSWEWICDGVRMACEIARGRGLVPSLEPEPGMAIATMADFERLVADLGSDSPSLTLDIGHLYVTESEPPDAAIARHGARLAQVHLEDMRAGVHEHLVPGEGEVDFPLVQDALRQTGYEGAVCFELSRSSHRAPEVLEICRRVWQGS